MIEFNTLKKSYEDLFDLSKDLETEDDNDLENELNKNIVNTFNKLKSFELICFLDQEHDKLDCYIEVHAGAGGTESQDWAEMLRRMYVKWAEKKDYKYDLIHETKGDEAGIKSSTVKLSGINLYGFLKRESGIHRLVRISPFDSNKRRHTSFSSVWVYPVINDDIQIEIQDKDLRIDTYRSSGAGGQHVNTTDSAVRITHLPTGIVAQCQNERSQHKNKATALNILRARIYELEQKKKDDKNKSINQKKEIGWGNQIRSYVLQPYKLVKDLRTEYQSPNPNKVLDGDIDEFLENSLHKINA